MSAPFYRENLNKVMDALYAHGAHRIAVVDHIDKSFNPPEYRSFELYGITGGRLVLVSKIERRHDRQPEPSEAFFEVWRPMDESNCMDALLTAISDYANRKEPAAVHLLTMREREVAALKTESDEALKAFNMLIGQRDELAEVLRDIDAYFTIIDAMQPTRDRGTEGERVRNRTRAAIAKLKGAK